MNNRLHLFIYICVLLAAVTPDATAQRVTRLSAQRAGRYVNVSYDLDLSQTRVRSNQMVAYIPVVSDTLGHSATLPAILVTGRNQHYFYLRNHGNPHYPGAREYQAAEVDSIDYAEALAYEPWMAHATLSLRHDLCGCGGDPLSQEAVAETPVRPSAFRPQYAFAFAVPPVEAVKEREISGRANVEFIVDKWDIVEDYRDNYAEYQKIRRSIEQVAGDADARIVAIALKGFASPESPYDHNTMLARNRVAAIKRYVQQLYGLPADIISTDYEPEDWQGLRQFVEASSLEHRAEILQLIDTPMEPDRKEALIRQRYPEEYRLMLSTWYPALRHTDYKIQYVISNFTDPLRCLELVRTAPQKLSLNEFYVAAQQCEPGSDDYNYVFETAVRMYPDSEVACLNAANIALGRGDAATAQRLLARVPQSAEATNARGVLMALQGRYDEAQQLLQSALDGGIAQASQNIEQARQARDFTTEE